MRPTTSPSGQIQILDNAGLFQPLTVSPDITGTFDLDLTLLLLFRGDASEITNVSARAGT